VIMAIYPGGWEVANRLEIGRAACGVAISHDQVGRELIFVIGGQVSDNSSALQSVEIYDVNTWERAWPNKDLKLPKGVYSAGVTTDRTGRIYVVGGSTVPSDPNPSKSVYRLDPTDPDRGWEELSALPYGLCGMGVGVIGDVLYALAGAKGYQNGRYIMSEEIHELALSGAGSWQLCQTAKVQPGRNLIASASTADSIFLVGGYANDRDSSGTYGSRPYIERFYRDGSGCPRVDRVGQLAVPRHGAAALCWDGKWLVVLGGMLDHYGGGFASNDPRDDVNCFDIATRTWGASWEGSWGPGPMPPITDMRHRRYRFGAAAAVRGKGRIFAAGGDSDGELNNVESFLPYRYT
jgi:hypothetical protein